MVTKCKVTSNIEMELEYRLFGYTPMVHGKIRIKQGRGKKPIRYSFVWNMGADTHPTIIERPYNKTEVEQLAGMIQFYINIIEPEQL